jgi:hypothetical protein
MHATRGTGSALPFPFKTDGRHINATDLIEMDKNLLLYGLMIRKGILYVKGF